MRCFAFALLLMMASKGLGQADVRSATVVCEVYETKKSTMEAYLTGPTISATEILGYLRTMEAAQHKSATLIVKLPAITVKTGERGSTQSDDVSLKVDLTFPKGSEIIDVAVEFVYGAKLMVTKASLRINDAVLLGTLESADRDKVQVVFLHCLRNRGTRYD